MRGLHFDRLLAARYQTLVAMAPRADSERIYSPAGSPSVTASRTTACRSRNPSDGAMRGGIEAAGHGLPKDVSYWEAGEGWIAEERAKSARRSPCQLMRGPTVTRTLDTSSAKRFGSITRTTGSRHHPDEPDRHRFAEMCPCGP